MENFIRIFENFAFPVALSIVLLWAISRFAQKVLENIDRREKESLKLRDQYIHSLQFTNVELTGALRENTTAFKEVAEALKRFSTILENLKNKLDKYE
jgi:hypothetical protein